MATSDPETQSARRLQWLPTVDQALELMLKAINEATTSVCLEMYIYTDSPIGEQFREALVGAASRGLKVRVLIDALGSMTLPERFWEPLREAGGEFRWFNPLRLTRWSIRSYRKVLVCDDEIAFVGGFNIAPEYQGDGVTKGWHDLGVMVRGPLAQALAGDFTAIFALADFKQKRFARLRKNRAAGADVSTPDGQLLVNAPGRGRSYIKQSLLKSLGPARRAHIIAAYFLPTRPILKAFNRIARSGGSVKLILAGKSDIMLSQLASRYFYERFLRAGVEIYEYQPQILHTKLSLIDDQVYVGSANLDRRGLFLNYELLLRLTEPEVVREAEQTFNRALGYSTRIERTAWLSSRSFWSRLKERWAFFILARVDPFFARRQFPQIRKPR